MPMGIGLGISPVSGGGGVSNPLSAANLRFEAGLGHTAADGAAVASWLDQSRAGQTASQATGGSRYTYRATGGPNGLPYMDGSGGAAFMAVSNSFAVARIYVVARVPSPQRTWSGTSAFLGPATAGAGNVCGVFVSGNTTWSTSAGTTEPLAVNKNGVARAHTGAWQCEPLTDWGLYVIDLLAPAAIRNYLIGKDVGQQTAKVDLAALIAVPTIPDAVTDAAIRSYLLNKYLPSTLPVVSESAGSGVPAGYPAGLIHHVGANAGVYSDLLRATPANDADEVLSLADQSGYNNDFLKANTGVATTYRATGVTGKPALRFSGGFLALGQPLVLDALGDFSLALSFTPTAHTTAVNGVLTKGDSGTYRHMWQWVKGLLQLQGIGTKTYLKSGLVGERWGFQAAVFTWNAGSSLGTLYVNGYPLYTVASIPAFLRDYSWRLGAYSNAGTVLNGDFHALSIWNRALSGAEAASVCTKLAALFEDSVRIIGDGNSITNGSGSTTGGYPRLLWDKLATDVGKNYHIANQGIGGRNWTTQLADIATTITPLLDPARTNLICAFEGTNMPITNAANVYNATVAYCNAVRALDPSVRVIVGTQLPSVSYAGANDAIRLAANASIVANWATFADGLADLAADPNIGQAGDNNDATYYTDGTHPNDTGYAIVAGIFETAIRTYLGI